MRVRERRVAGRDHVAERDRALANAGSLLDDAQVLWHVDGHSADVREHLALVFGEIGRAWLSHQLVCGVGDVPCGRHDVAGHLAAAWAFLGTRTVLADPLRCDDEQVAELLRSAVAAVRAARGMRTWEPPRQRGVDIVGA